MAVSLWLVNGSWKWVLVATRVPLVRASWLHLEQWWELEEDLVFYFPVCLPAIPKGPLISSPKVDMFRNINNLSVL